MVTTFYRDLITGIGAAIVAAVPGRLFSVNEKAGFIGRKLVTDMVKNIEFIFRAQSYFVGDAGFFHVGFCSGRNGTGVLIESIIFRLGYDEDITDHA